MRLHRSLLVCLFLALIAQLLPGAEFVVPKQITIGYNLQVFASIKLSEPAPPTGLEVTIKSADPQRLKFATDPDKAGTDSLTIKVNSGYRDTPDFYLQGFADRGTARYTVSASGFRSAKGAVTLAPSAIMIAGPFKAPSFRTTTGLPTKITLHSALLDKSRRLAARQPIAGGVNVKVEISSSDTKVGSVAAPTVTIPGGESIAAALFTPAGVGNTTLSVAEPNGFTTPAEYTSVTANVELPGLGLTGEINLGKDLEVEGTVLLGQPPPKGGLEVIVTSSDPSRMLLSDSRDKLGSPSVKLTIAEGELRAPYFIQSLGDSGIVMHKASASGYRTREAPVSLVPSGIIVAYSNYGPPDRAEVERAIPTLDPRPFTASLSERQPVHLALWPAYLHPQTRRGADVTVQRLRPGVSVAVDLKNSDPAVAEIASTVTLTNNSAVEMVELKPKSVGKTEITISTPNGFTTPSNATSVTAMVKE